MNCAWQAYLNLLPPGIRGQVDKLGKNQLLEMRLREGMKAELVTTDGFIYLDHLVVNQDITYCINSASRYSPWAHQTTSFGYITAPGGHRLGICGEMAVNAGINTGIRTPTSLCIRVARDFPNIADGMKGIKGSVLIVGAPGCGKTTLLRDLIRQQSETGTFVSVVDEREEIFPRVGGSFCFYQGAHTDILTGCQKTTGIEILLRTMTPQVIAVDEITAKEDCDAVLKAGWCGVRLLATIHAGSLKDFYKRPIYKPLSESGLFDTVVVMGADKSYKIERTNLCK